MTAKKQGKRRPASYFIDYENVRGAGLDGVETLQKGDEVFVLYGSKDSALKLGAVQNVLDSPAKVRFIKVATGKHDALDFQLVALMFMQMKKKRDYYVVSRDTGFDFAIRMAKERGFEHVYRRETISGATLEQKKLPSPKRSRAKRLPQPKDAVPAAEASPEIQPNETAAEAKEQQAPKRSRRRGSRRGKRQDAAPANAPQDEAPLTEAGSTQGQQGKAAKADAEREVASREQAPQAAASSPEAAAPEVLVEEPAMRPVAEEKPAEAAEPAVEPAPQAGEAPAQAPTAARKPRRRSRRAKQEAVQSADPYRARVEEVLTGHMGSLPEAKKVDAVIAALDACETKARFYNYLRGNLGNDQGVAFYREVKGCFEQLRAIER